MSHHVGHGTVPPGQADGHKSQGNQHPAGSTKYELAADALRVSTIHWILFPFPGLKTFLIIRDFFS
jgi:hypothetical protein